MPVTQNLTNGVLAISAPGQVEITLLVQKPDYSGITDFIT